MLNLPMQIAGWRGKCLGDSCNFDETSGLPLRMWPNKHTNSFPKCLPSCHALHPLIKYPGWGKKCWVLKFQHTERRAFLPLGYSFFTEIFCTLGIVPLKVSSGICQQGVPIARRSNQSILKEISPEYSLEGLMLKPKLQYFGYLMQRTDSFEKTLMLGKDWRQEEKGTTEDEMVGWHHWLDGHEFE